MAARKLATAIPRSLCPCTDMVTFSMPLTPLLSFCMSWKNSWGVVYPTVSGTLSVVAPASTATEYTWQRKSGSLLRASSAENSTSSTRLWARLTISLVISSTCSLVFFSLCSMWMSEVAMKVWMRGNLAGLTASAQASMSLGRARASPQMMGGSSLLPTSCAIFCTALKSPGDAKGNPASITSTPKRCSCLATLIFSSSVMVHPGLCSPSLRVVSNTRTRVGSRPVARSCAFGVTHTGFISSSPSLKPWITTGFSWTPDDILKLDGRYVEGWMGALTITLR
mmetsp:Transcript_15708/g.23087  ORF Transcript_15708/g.23087 Transcript_15708/m.23087 type:complete len:281 (-) Transcript_15708:152-994(-)